MYNIFEKLFGTRDVGKLDSGAAYISGNASTLQYSGQPKSVESVIPPCLERVQEWLRDREPSVVWDQMLVKGYRDGGDYSGGESSVETGATFYSFSFGATRTFRIRATATNAIVADIQVCNGMALTVREDATSEYFHEIVKVGGPKGVLVGRHIDVTVLAKPAPEKIDENN